MDKDFEDWASFLEKNFTIPTFPIKVPIVPIVIRALQSTQTQKTLNLFRDASVSIKPALESMRLATEVSTSMSHKFPAIADLYSPAPTRIPIAVRTLQSTQLASVAKSLSLQPIISYSFRKFADLVRTGRLYELLLQESIDLPEFLRELDESGWYLSDRLYDKIPGTSKNWAKPFSELPSHHEKVSPGVGFVWTSQLCQGGGRQFFEVPYHGIFQT